MLRNNHDAENIDKLNEELDDIEDALDELEKDIMEK
jgi:hypothetical protein